MSLLLKGEAIRDVFDGKPHAKKRRPLGRPLLALDLI